jgi:hypothetical protein
VNLGSIAAFEESSQELLFWNNFGFYKCVLNSHNLKNVLMFIGLGS